MNSIQAVTFFGSSRIKAHADEYKAAYETAFLVAQKGLTVVNGGGPGEMLAATEGAKKANGKVNVVYFDPKHATSFEEKNALNEGDKEFTESNYLARTQKLLELGDVYVCFKGGTGTISEFAMAWGLSKLYFGHNKPLILFGTFWREIMDVFKKNMYMHPVEYKVFTIVEKPIEVIEAIEKYELMAKIKRHSHKNGKSDEHAFML